jgi:hypothetical protein
MEPSLVTKIKEVVGDPEFPDAAYCLHIGNESWFITKGEVLDEAPDGIKEDCIISIEPMAALSLAKNPKSAMNLFLQKKVLFSSFSEGAKLALFLHKKL